MEACAGSGGRVAVGEIGVSINGVAVGVISANVVPGVRVGFGIAVGTLPTGWITFFI